MAIELDKIVEAPPLGLLPQQLVVLGQVRPLLRVNTLKDGGTLLVERERLAVGAKRVESEVEVTKRNHHVTAIPNLDVLHVFAKV